MDLSSLSGTRTPAKDLSARWMAFFCLALILGAALRGIWLADMEYKDDERWMFEHAMRIPATEPWPELGMSSGVGLRNPGLSVAVFVVLAKLIGHSGPLGLCGVLVAANVLAFALLFAMVLRERGLQREVWLWALALAAISPLSVVLQRKIWAQSVLPLFCALFLLGWLHRSKRWGAALWGLMGALLGQIHMSGFFFAAGFFCFEVFTQALKGSLWRTKWWSWVSGSGLGTLPLIPWLFYAVTSNERTRSNFWENVSGLRFFRHWVSDALGTGLDYSLGEQYLDFLRYPVIGSGDYYPALYLHGVAFTIGTYIAFASVRGLWSHLRRRDVPVVTPLTRLSQETRAVLSAFVAYGVLLTLSGVFVHRHYLIVTFPLEWLSVALLALKFARKPRRVLLVLWCAQLGLSMTFLHYIHENHGALHGDYGLGFRWSGEYQKPE